MSFRVLGLDPSPFRHLFGLSADALARHGVTRMIADAKPGFPDRIALRDASPGETLLLLNYVHQPADTPYRASHAIFVGETAEAAYDRVDDIPEVLRVRMISLRAFAPDHDMVDAALVDGRALEAAITRFLDDRRVGYLQAHYAVRGCYAARVERPLT